VRRLTPRPPRPRAPSRVDPAWPGTRNFGIRPANRRRAGFPACGWPAGLRHAGFPTCVPWSSRNGCERGCAPQATGLASSSSATIFHCIQRGTIVFLCRRHSPSGGMAPLPVKNRKTPLFFVKAPVLSRLAKAQLIACRQVA